jgi:hypothetical protein
MLPTALWVTSITDGRAGVHSLFARVVSEVYCGFDIELRRPVAIKRLRPELGNNPGFRRIAGVYNAGGEPHFGSGLTIDTAAELFGGKV